ncbi:MAG: tRNA (guanosine(46)-N7)-methyltransferase TrmB [Pseudomonadota bacterium]
MIDRHSTIRSFVTRAGRVTPAQRRALDRHWAQYGLARDVPISRDAFPGADRLVIEIGFGNGEGLAAAARANRTHHFVGIEVHEAGIGRLLQTAHDAALENLHVVQGDAVEVLTHVVIPSGIDEIWIYFPDPWPKKRHHKRRLINPAFVALLASRLAPAGLAKLATDWVPYAEQILEVFRASSDFRNLSHQGDYIERPSSRHLTKFEQRGQRLGHEVRDLAFERI